MQADCFSQVADSGICYYRYCSNEEVNELYWMREKPHQRGEFSQNFYAEEATENSLHYQMLRIHACNRIHGWLRLAGYNRSAILEVPQLQCSPLRNIAKCDSVR